MTLKNKLLEEAMCKELEHILKLDNLATDPKVHIASMYHHYKWERRVKDPETFKRALAQYRKRHPDIDIISEEIHIISPVIQYSLYAIAIIGSLASILTFIV